MAERYPGGVISKTPPTVTPPVAGEGGSASGMWTLDTVLEYEKAGAWPKPLLPRELYGWGRNSAGQVGDGTVVYRSSPVQIGSLTNWAQVSAGKFHTASVKTDGTLWTWGLNSRGALGQNTVYSLSRSSPVQVGALTNWYQASAGSQATLAVKADGTLWSWGNNNHGQLGQNDLVYRSSPVQVGALTGWSQASSSAGQYFSAAVKSDGTLWTWGRNNYGQLGQGINITESRSSPVQVGALTNWYQVVTGYEQTAAIKTDGTMWSWGRAAFGSLGTGDPNVSRSSPVQIGALTSWASVSVGRRFGGAIKTDGTLWTWGANYRGQIGDGTRVDKSSPVQVGALTNWSRVTAAYYQMAAVKTDGTLWSWGFNGAGQLGTSNIINRSSPVQVGSNTNWSGVSSTMNTMVAITKG